MRPLFRRRPLRNAVRMLLGIDPSRNARVRTRAWARGQGSPDTPLAKQTARSTYISPTDNFSEPLPSDSLPPVTEPPTPITPMAQAVQPTANAMAVASDTDLDQPAAPMGGMRLVDAAPTTVTTSGSGSSRLYPTLPSATPRPATTEVQIPQPAPMVRAVNAQPKKPVTSPASAATKPTVAKTAPSDASTTQQPVSSLGSEAAQMLAQSTALQTQAAQMRSVFRQREQQWVNSDRSEAGRLTLDNMADDISRMESQALLLRQSATTLLAQDRALTLQERQQTYEQSKPVDTLKSNRQMLADTATEYGIDPAVDGAMGFWRSELQSPPDTATETAQRQIFTQNALTATYANVLRKKQPPVKGDYFTTSLANLAYAKHPRDPKARKRLVGSVVGAGLVMSKVQGGGPQLGMTLTDSVARMVEELIAEGQQ